MANPTPWILEEETETDRLRTALAESRTDLQQRDAALLKLQGELMASRLEVAGARGETVQFQGLLRRAEEAAASAAQAIARLESAAASRDTEIAQLHAIIATLQAVIATLQAETSALRAGMDLLRASVSWRISVPVRVAGRLMRGIRTAGSRLLRAIQHAPRLQTAPVAQPAVALPRPGDPDAGAIFQAAPFVEHPVGEAESIVTLDTLYHLSRSL
jgi:hypothetical protein